MKKTLLAAALLAGYTGTALAQNSVTLYGRISPAILYESIKANDTAAQSLGVNADTYNQVGLVSGYAPGAAHWGLKGVEDVGNGLKVGFNLEQAVDLDDGAATGFTRKAFLSVSNSAWGTVHIGKDYTAGSTILSGISPLGTAYGVGSAFNAFGAFSINAGDQFKYISPSFSGLTFGASYSFGGNTAVDSNFDKFTDGYGTANKNRLAEAGLRYANGPVVLAANYVQITPNSATNLDGTKPKNWTVGGTYDLKVAKLHAAYGQNIDGIVSGRTQLDALGGKDGTNFGGINANGLAAEGIETNQWMAGLSAPVGSAGKAMFGVSQQRPGGDLKDLDGTATMTNFGVVYSYSLSKRTSLYGSYSYASNYGMVDGVTVNQVGAGVVHLF